VCADTETYSEAFLGKDPAAYAAWIQDEEKWGGEIEISILSKALAVEVCTVDVMTGNVYKYQGNPPDADAPRSIFIIYDGIHYDAIVKESSIGEQRIFYPTVEGTDYEKDICALARELKEKKQFTDLTGFDLRCLVCQVGLVGQAGAQKHAKETGHMNFSEYTGT